MNTQALSQCRPITNLASLLIFFFIFLPYLQAADLSGQLYEGQWHRLRSINADQIYMQGKLPTPLLLDDLTDSLPFHGRSSPSSGRVALAVSLLDTPPASLSLCVKKPTWWTEKTVAILDFSGGREAGSRLPAPIEPACSSLVDGNGNRYLFMPEALSGSPGLFDIIIFELTPLKPSSTSLPQAQASQSGLMAYAGSPDNTPWHDPKWRFYPGPMQESLGYLDISPFWVVNPFALLFLHPDSLQPQGMEQLTIHFIHADGTESTRTISRSQFMDLTGKMSITHPDFWKLLAGSEISVEVGEVTDLSSMCRLSLQLGVEAARLSGQLLSGPVQSPPGQNKKPGRSQPQTYAGSGSARQQGAQQGRPSKSPSAPYSAGQQNSGDGEREKPPGGFQSAADNPNDLDLLVDVLVEAAETGNKQVVKDLIEKNGTRLLFHRHSTLGVTALQAAIKARQIGIVSLIKNGCKVSDSDFVRLLQQLSRHAEDALSLFIQDEVAGNKDCPVHQYCTGKIALPCCNGSICQLTLNRYALGITKCSQQNDNLIDCPVCTSRLDVLQLMEYLLEKATVGTSILEMPGIGLSPEDRGRVLALYEQYRSFSEVLHLFRDQINARERFRERVVLLKNSTCGICLETADCIQISPDRQCRHQFCGQCLKAYLDSCAASVEALRSGYATCPGEHCSVEIPYYIITILAGSEIRNRIDKSMLRQAASKEEHLFACPSCFTFMDTKDGCGPKIICPFCARSSCSQCGVSPFHTPLSCEQYQAALTTPGAERMFAELKEKQPWNYRKCPGCKAQIYKDEGCNMVFCNSCGVNFCWQCLAILRPEEYGHFGQCLGLQERQPVGDQAGGAEARP